MFDKELKFFIANQTELVTKYRGTVLVIRGERVEGAYPSAIAAYTEARQRFEPGTFMIQPCEPGPEAYTVTISSAAW